MPGTPKDLYNLLKEKGYISQMDYPKFEKDIWNSPLIENVHKKLVQDDATLMTFEEFMGAFNGKEAGKDNSATIELSDDDIKNADNITDTPAELGKTDADTGQEDAAGTDSPGVSASSASPIVPLMRTIKANKQLEELKAERNKLSVMDPAAAELTKQINFYEEKALEGIEDKKGRNLAKKNKLDSDLEEDLAKMDDSFYTLSEKIPPQEVVKFIKKQKEDRQATYNAQLNSDFTEEELHEFEAVKEILRDSNNYSSVRADNDQESSGIMRWIDDYGFKNPKNQKESERLNVSAEIQAEIMASLSKNDKYKAANATMPLREKNEVVKNARFTVLARKRKEVEQEFVKNKAELTAEVKGLAKELDQINLEIQRGDISDEKYAQYEMAFGQKKARIDSAVASLQEYEEQALESLDELDGLYGYEEGRGMTESFIVSQKILDKRENGSNAGNVLGALGEGIYQVAGNIISAPFQMATILGGLGQENGYGISDLVLDKLTNNINADFFQVKDGKFVDEAGDINTKDIASMATATAQMLPFSLAIIQGVKNGRYKSASKAMGQIKRAVTASSKTGKGIQRLANLKTTAAQSLKDDLIMAEVTMKATYLDNWNEAKAAGLEGSKAHAFATTKSAGTAISQMIMPDYALVKGNGAELIKGLKGSLKAAAGRKATFAASKQFAVNLLKEAGEEEVDYVMGELTNIAFGVDYNKSLSDYITEQKEVAAGTVALTTLLGGAGAVRGRRQVKKMLMDRFTIDGVESLNYLQKLAQVAEKEGFPKETVQELKDAYSYGLNLVSIAETNPEAVTIDQLDMLLEFNDLQQQKVDAMKTGVPSDVLLDKIDKASENIKAKTAEVNAYKVKTDIATTRKLVKKMKLDVVVPNVTTMEQAYDLVKPELEGTIDPLTGKEYTKEGMEAFIDESAGLNYTNKEGSDVIFINQSLSQDGRRTGQHELLHQVMRKALAANPELASELGVKLDQEIQVLLNRGLQIDKEYVDRMYVYAEEAETAIQLIEKKAQTQMRRFQTLLAKGSMTQANFDMLVDKLMDAQISKISAELAIVNEEKLTVLAELMADGKVRRNKGKQYKTVFGYVAEFTDKLLGDLDFGSETGVYDFIEAYNEGFAKGKLNRRITRFAKKGEGFNFAFPNQTEKETKKEFEETHRARKSLTTKRRVTWKKVVMEEEEMDVDYAMWSSGKIRIGEFDYEASAAMESEFSTTRMRYPNIKSSLEIEFFKYKADGKMTQRLQKNDKNALEVMSIMSNAFIELAEETKADALSLYARDENNRQRAYRLITNRVASSIGYRMDEVEVGEDFVMFVALAPKNKSTRKLLKQSKTYDAMGWLDIEEKYKDSKSETGLKELTAYAVGAYQDNKAENEWMLSMAAETWTGQIKNIMKTTNPKTGQNYREWMDAVGEEKVDEFAGKVAVGAGSQSILGLLKSFKPGTKVVKDAGVGEVNEGKEVNPFGYVNKYIRNKIDYFFQKDEVIKGKGDQKDRIKAFETSSYSSDTNFTQLVDEEASAEFEFGEDLDDAGTMQRYKPFYDVLTLKPLLKEDIDTAVQKNIARSIELLFAAKTKNVKKDPFVVAVKQEMKMTERENKDMFKFIKRYGFAEFLQDHLASIYGTVEIADLGKIKPLARFIERRIKGEGWTQQTKLDNGKYGYVHKGKVLENLRDPLFERDTRFGNTAGPYYRRRTFKGEETPGLNVAMRDFYLPKGKPDNRRLKALAELVAAEIGLSTMQQGIMTPGSDIYNSFSEKLNLLKEVTEEEKAEFEKAGKTVREDLLTQAMSQGLTENIIAEVTKNIERKDIKQSKAPVNKTGFAWFDKPRIDLTNFLREQSNARDIVSGAVRNRQFDELVDDMEFAFDSYLKMMGNQDTWSGIQQSYAEAFKDRNFKDFKDFVSDTFEQSQFNVESSLGLSTDFTNLGKGSQEKQKLARKEGVEGYINSVLASVPKSNREVLFAGLIKQLLGATAAPDNQGLYVNTTGFYDGVVKKMIKKHKFSADAFKLIDVVDGKSISYKGAKITSDLTKGVYSKDVFGMISSVSDADGFVNSTINVQERARVAREARELFMFYMDWLQENHKTMSPGSVGIMVNSMVSKMRAIGQQMQPITKAMMVSDGTLLSDYRVVPEIPPKFIALTALDYVVSGKGKSKLMSLLESGTSAVLPVEYANVINQLHYKTPRMNFTSENIEKKLIQMGLPPLVLSNTEAGEQIPVVDLNTLRDTQDFRNRESAMKQSKFAEPKSMNIVPLESILAGAKITEDTAIISELSPGEVMKALAEANINVNSNQVTGRVTSERDFITWSNAIGFNDITFKQSKTEGINALLGAVNVTSPETKKQIEAAKAMNKKLHVMIENKKGVNALEKWASADAQNAGRKIDGWANILKEGRNRVFVPASADDFQGLLYRMLNKGEQGNKDFAFMQETLVRPYTRGIEWLDNQNTLVGKKYNEIVAKHSGMMERLFDLVPNTDYTWDQAIRYAIYNANDENHDALSKAVGTRTGVRMATQVTQVDGQAKAFFKDLLSILGTQVEMDPNWINKSIATDFKSLVSTSQRKAALSEWSDNVDVIFDTETLQKIEAVYGTKYRKALEGSIRRMRMGTKGALQLDGLSRKVHNWINGAIMPIMFLNTRSGVLQLMSITNFINWTDNNPFHMMKAMANTKQFWSDVKMIFNSDKLSQRRAELRMSIEESEIANIKGAEGFFAMMRAKAVSIGFTPTKFADSVAISFGGASMYRNRVNTYLREGMSKKEAEKKAWIDFSAQSDEAQQSSDQMFISEEQASPYGRILLAFANTPAQYARLTKKAFLDLVNRRGDRRTNFSKLMYYSVIQNVTFSMMQNLIMKAAFGDDEVLSEEEIAKIEMAIKLEKDKDKKKQLREYLAAVKGPSDKIREKRGRLINGVVNTLLRGSGIGGAVVAAIKDMGLAYHKEMNKDLPNNLNVIAAGLSISPPLGAKVRDVNKMINISKFDKHVMDHYGADLRSPRYYQLAVGARFAFNSPTLEAAFKRLNKFSMAVENEAAITEWAWLAAGWTPYDLGMEDVKEKRINEAWKVKNDMEKREEAAALKILQEIQEINRWDNLTAAEKAQEKAEAKAKAKAAAAKGANTRRINKAIKDKARLDALRNNN